MSAGASPRFSKSFALRSGASSLRNINRASSADYDDENNNNNRSSYASSLKRTSLPSTSLGDAVIAEMKTLDNNGTAASNNIDDDSSNNLDITWLRSRRRHMIDVSGTEKRSSSVVTNSKSSLNDLLLEEHDTNIDPEKAAFLKGQQNEYGSNGQDGDANNNNGHYSDFFDDEEKTKKKRTSYSMGLISSFLAQIPAIAIVCLLNLMLSIPFGVVYFPVGWSSSSGGGDIVNATAINSDSLEEDEVLGPFPLPGKESLGIRMCLFATLIGQLAMTFTSKFTNPICFQMIENVPFFHALAFIVISQQGYGKEALSTLFFLFGSSSVIVGIVFYLLGRFDMGRIVYFFPNHVLVGCIGGIGVFIVLTAVEVTINTPFGLDIESFISLIENFHLFGLVLFFELSLRLIVYLTTDKKTHQPKYPLLPPIFYCLITPVFYLALFILRIDMKHANDAGYFFPPIASSSDEEGGAMSSSSSHWSTILNDGHVFDLFYVIDFRSISWTAVLNSLSTMVALTIFSLIHVPINIPAFSISTDVDVDMNNELMAHGWSNGISGLCGGLPNYMTYSVSVLYAKSGGYGRASSLVICLVTFVFFIIGPGIATYIPRCMAGTLLLHVGLDLFLEGIYDSYGSYDNIEYAGIWFIAIVMTTKGMTAALIAGTVVALLTYAAQSITHLNPIHRTMDASTLRSSSWTRSAASLELLDDKDTGRSRIFIIQLQGHLFFGNIAQLTDTIKDLVAEKQGTDQQPIIVIIDFTLVVGMDSSAAHSVAKLKTTLQRQYNVEVTAFVTGCDRGGFPCAYALSQALVEEEAVVDLNDVMESSYNLHDVSDHDDCMNSAPRPARGSIAFAKDSASLRALQTSFCQQSVKNRVCESLDDALIFSEDILIAREDPELLESDSLRHQSLQTVPEEETPIEEERRRAVEFLIKIGCRNPQIDEEIKRDFQKLFSYFAREECKKDDIIWKQHSKSECAKLVVWGKLICSTEGTNEKEVVDSGNLVGEFGLVQGSNRFNTLKCLTETAVLYNLDKESWKKLGDENPRVARIIDSIVIRYLSHRVQHVRNRIFDVGGLPV